MQTKLQFLEEFRRFLAERGLRLTNQRRRVTELLMQSRGHQTAEELAVIVRQKRMGVGRATVYRTLDLLCQAGLVHGHDFGQGMRHYEPVFGQAHHDHMRCTDCGTIIEFECPEIEQLQEEMARQYKFTLISHRLEMFGYCAPCAVRSPRRRPVVESAG